MEKIAAAVFALAALGGATLATMHLRGKKPPPAFVIGHGLGGLTGIVLLMLAVNSAGAAGNMGLALGLFVAVALGGFALHSFDLRGKPLPTPLIAVHGLGALAAFGLLLAYLLSSAQQ